MSDDGFDELGEELLALAGDGSDAEEQHDTRASPRPSRSSSPRSQPQRSSPPPSSQPGSPAQTPPRKKASRKAGSSRRKRGGDSDDEEGEASDASSPNSLGSGAMEESDSEAGSGGEANDPSGYPVEGLYKSHAEKSEIMSMNEVQREAIIADRLAEKKRKEQDLKLMSLMAAQKRKAENEHEDSPRATKAKKPHNEPLAAYLQARDKRKTHRSSGGRAVSSAQQDQSDEDAEGDSEVEWDEGPKAAPAREDPPPDIRDYERVRVGRTNFGKVCFYPGFEDAITGCFCRVSVGVNKQTNEPEYRMCQIKGFKEGNPYSITAPNGRVFKTDQYAIVSHGKAEKEWPFVACSDSKFTDAEFNRYKTVSEVEEVKMPTKKNLSDKLQNIHDLLAHQWTEAEVKEKLRRQNKFQDHASVNKPAAVTNKASDRLAALNIKNRKANAIEIRRALVNERREQDKAREEAVRRRTLREREAFMAEQRALAQAKETTDPLFEESDTSRTATPADKKGPTEAPSGEKEKKGIPTFRKRAMDDDVIGSMDLGIDIEI